jgi:hypothetical protein
LFEDWLKGNDMAAGVYVALTADPSSSCPPMANAPRGGQKSHADSLTPRRQRRIDHLIRNPKIWKHRVGDQKEQKNLRPETMPLCLHCVAVLFRRLILTKLNGKLCTLILLKKVLLILLNVRTNKMFNVFYVFYNSFKFYFTRNAWCTFACMPQYFYMVTCACPVSLCVLPSSRFPLHL